MNGLLVNFTIELSKPSRFSRKMFNLVGFGQLVFILNIRLKETSAYFDYDPDID